MNCGSKLYTIPHFLTSQKFENKLSRLSKYLESKFSKIGAVKISSHIVHKLDANFMYIPPSTPANKWDQARLAITQDNTIHKFYYGYVCFIRIIIMSIGFYVQNIAVSMYISEW